MENRRALNFLTFVMFLIVMLIAIFLFVFVGPAISSDDYFDWYFTAKPDTIKGDPNCSWCGDIIVYNTPQNWSADYIELDAAQFVETIGGPAIRQLPIPDHTGFLRTSLNLGYSGYFYRRECGQGWTYYQVTKMSSSSGCWFIPDSLIQQFGLRDCWTTDEQSYCNNGTRTIQLRCHLNGLDNEVGRFDTNWPRLYIMLVPATFCGFEDFLVQQYGYFYKEREIRHDSNIRHLQPDSTGLCIAYNVPAQTYYAYAYEQTGLDSVNWYTTPLWEYIDATSGDVIDTLFFHNEPIDPIRDGGGITIMCPPWTPCEYRNPLCFDYGIPCDSLGN